MPCHRLYYSTINSTYDTLDKHRNDSTIMLPTILKGLVRKYL